MLDIVERRLRGLNGVLIAIVKHDFPHDASDAIVFITLPLSQRAQ